MEPTIGFGEFLPFWVWTGITGALMASTVFLYLPEIKRAGLWVIRRRKRRTRELAREIVNVQRENVVRDIVRLYKPRKDGEE